MARPREFDEETALDQATQLFWAQGFKRTSLDDLLGAMKIQKGSFYNTFGTKRELYLRCLARYRDSSMVREGPFGQVLAAVQEGPAAVRAVLSSQLDGFAQGDACCGCFVAAASSEHRGRSQDVIDVTRPGVEAATDALAEAITEAQQAGRMPPEADPGALAYLLITMGYGSHVLAAAGVPKEALLGSMDAMFAMMAS